ncbi:MAG: SAM-dependent methyltransferase [Lysobacterales bacterium]
MSSNSGGRLVCVGTGMLLGGHLSPRARVEIERADVVHAAVSDGLVELWLRELNPAFHSLQPHYVEGRPRTQTYEAMVQTLLDAVIAGQRVCGAFYGHPGVFAWVPHEAVRRARSLGYPARLEPGISAEDCLYADLGIDPGRVGCQHYEASQFMLFRRRIDTGAYLILWQPGVAGDRSTARFSTGADYRRLLVEVLRRDYPSDHPLTLYRAATLALEQPRMTRLRLADLPDAVVTLADTLVIPPLTPLQPDLEIRQCLDQLDLLQQAADDPS